MTRTLALLLAALPLAAQERGWNAPATGGTVITMGVTIIIFVVVLYFGVVDEIRKGRK